jgi:hypothetical protein
MVLPAGFRKLRFDFLFFFPFFSIFFYVPTKRKIGFSTIFLGPHFSRTSKMGLGLSKGRQYAADYALAQSQPTINITLLNITTNS